MSAVGVRAWPGAGAGAGAERVRVLVGSLAEGRLPTATGPRPAGTILLDLGADHPSNAGLLELRLWTDHGVIERAEIVVGALHRGAEKLFEVRDYTQILMLADRHDWHAPFSGELVIALACEHQLGLAIPERAVWLRTLLAEHTRIISHCGFLGWVSRAAGESPSPYAVRERLRIQTLRLTGNRIHPMANRIGGLAVDADAGWLADEIAIISEVRGLGHALRGMIMGPAVAARTAGVAVLRPETIAQYGVSGPAARASGVDLDLRRQQPYLGYAELTEMITSPQATAGDAQSRLAVLAEELITSADLVEACADRLRVLNGPTAVKLGKIIRLPEGDGYCAVEAPLGLAGVFISSRGEKTPWRLRLRTPSFSNISALEPLLVGVGVDTLEATLASMGYVVGDIDK